VCPVEGGATISAVLRFAVVLAGALLAWNSVVHLLPGASAAYVPLNLAAAGVVVGAARRHGLTWSDLGLRCDRVGAGARLGGVCAAIVAGALGIAAVAPALRPLLDDARVRSLGAGDVAYHALIRVPLGTVLFEELAFRGALLGAFARTLDWTRAAVASSVVFGLWHVRPTLGLIDANDVADDPLARAGLVAIAVVATTAGGMFFCLLRVRSDSTVAPIVAHTATNSLGILASAISR
jgi:uncharacterized protein